MNYPIVSCTTPGHALLTANLRASALRLGFDVEVSRLPSEDAVYGTAAFAALAVDKLQFLIDSIRDYGTFLYVDADCAFLQYPPDIAAAVPLHAQTYRNQICSGVMFCTPACAQLFTAALAWLTIHNASDDAYADDQIAIQRAVKAYDFPWKPLSVEHWPEGSSPWTAAAVLVHANWVVGVEAKIQRLIDAGAWFLPLPSRPEPPAATAEQERSDDVGDG